MYRRRTYTRVSVHIILYGIVCTMICIQHQVLVVRDSFTTEAAAAAATTTVMINTTTATPRDLLTRRLDAATASSSSQFDLHGHAAATSARAAHTFDVYAASCCKSLSSAAAAFTRTSYTHLVARVPRTQACIPADPFRYSKNCY